MNRLDVPLAVLTVNTEAAGEPFAAKLGVAHVLLNRLHIPGRFGKTLASVCLHRMQFSAFNDDRGDNANLIRAAELSDQERSMLDCNLALAQAMASVSDPTDGATHFYADTIPEPSWAKKGTLTLQAGRLRFYKDIP